MPPCAANCPIEAVTRDPGVSPGPVQDHEALSRGLYAPSHGKPGNIKNSHLPKKDLAARKLSVWRLSDVSGLDVDRLREMLLGNQQFGTLFAIASVNTRAVRDYNNEHKDGRILCIRDECDVDHAGNKHPAHAHIALCDVSFPDPVSTEAEEFLQTWRDLCRAFKEGVVWPVRP